VSEDTLDYIKSAAARHSSNSTAEAMDYVIYDKNLSISKDLDRMMGIAGKVWKQQDRLGGKIADGPQPRCLAFPLCLSV